MGPGRPPLGGLPGKIGLAILSSLLALVAAELALRWSERVPSDGNGGVDQKHVDLPALGFNSPPIPRAAAEGEFRILGLGDSFAFGPVKYPHTYYAVAGTTLTDDSEALQQFQFVNLGEPGLSFPHYVQRHQYWSQLIEHDAAVFTVFLGNDLLDLALGHGSIKIGLNEAIRQSGLEVLPGSRVDLLPKRYPLRLLDHLRYRYLLWSGAVRAPLLESDSPYHDFALQLDDEHYHDLAYGQLATFDPEQLPGLRIGYQEMIEFVRSVSNLSKTGLPVAIVLAPHELQVSRPLLDALVERYGLDPDRYDFGLPGSLIAETVSRIDPGIPLLDLTEPLARSAEKGTDLYFGTNTHWSIEGNRLVGVLLGRFLAKRWLGRDLELNDAGPRLGEKTSRRARIHEEFLLPLLGDASVSATRVRLEEIAALRRLDTTAMYGIQSVNGTPLTEPIEPGRPIPVATRDAGFHITGWAVDGRAEDLAAGVLVEIAGAVYRASYGLPREDVARSFTNPNYRQSGFSLLLPPETVPTGAVSVRIMALSRDGTGFYTGNPVSILIEKSPGT
jgi:hypothetical protein